MKTYPVRFYRVLSIILLPILVLGLPLAPARAAEQAAIFPQSVPPVPAHQADLPPDAPPDWWATVQEQIRQSEYEVTWQDTTYLPDTPAAYQAPNRTQGLRTYFTPEEVVVIPRTGVEDALPWQWGLRVSAASSNARLAPNANRVDYQHPDLPGLAEAYVNDESGLRHELTLASSLPGGGPGILDLSFSGGLVPGLSADGTAVDFSAADGAPVLRYTLLSVTGAQGQPLADHLELTGQSLRLVLDQGRPVYPLTIAARLQSAPLDAEGTRRAPQTAIAAMPEGLSASPNWAAEGNQDYACLGISVGAAGDVNGDGYSDVIVGAYTYDHGLSDEGVVFVYHGSASGLSATPNWMADGEQCPSPYFGFSSGTAGDVNGDGYADVIVGAFYYDSGQPNEGAAFVWYGSASGLGPNGTPANADWMAESDQTNAIFGYSVGTAGDVNGDGYADVVVGAHYYDNGQTDEGAAFVYQGSAAGLGDNGTPANADWMAEGNQVSAFFGHSVGMAGDVNGDGYADVIVGAVGYDNGQADEGAAFVYLGSAAGLSTTANWMADSDQSYVPVFGWSVGTAGDVNGDGYADVIIGAPLYFNGQWEEGAAFVYHGSAAGLGDNGTPANADWVMESNQAGAAFAYSVGTAGDVNGDGYAGVIVGEYYYQNGQTDEGAAFVYHGSAGGLSTTANWTVEGDQAEARFGSSVSTAGDVNGDGYADVIVGAFGYDNGQSNEGAAFVYHGSPTGLSAGPAWTAESDQADVYFGYSVSTAGDVNGDGCADVVVGAPFYDNGQADEGRAYVYHGSATGLGADPVWTAESDQIDAWFGISVGTAGDVNGDGYGDVIVGAWRYSNGQEEEGRAYVYYGSATGLSAGPAWTAEGDQALAYFGASGTAGDVNGDGYGDVIVGAHGYHNGQSWEGRAYVYHGSAAGLAADPAWTAESDHYQASFGYLVGTAGDVNGDGYSDVIVGAYAYDSGQMMEGRAFVYHGSAAGVGADPAWTAEGDQESAEFGWSVGTAGDVNGDGYADVIVGAWSYDNGQMNEGRAYVYHGSATGLSAGPAWTAESDQAEAYFGASVRTAGDVNGDGYSDVVIGAFWYDNDQADEGRVYVYHGSAAGLGADPAWTAESDQENAAFGYSVGTAGDLNGDGYGDVIVGAPGYSNGQQLEGRAFVYYGNGGDGLDVTPQQRRADDSVPIAHLGQSATNAFRLALLGRTPFGRGLVKLEWEVKPLGTLFDGMGLQHSAAWLDTGTAGVALDELVEDLSPSTVYHWRVRLRYHPVTTPFQQYSRWITQPWNGWNEADLRTPLAVQFSNGAYSVIEGAGSALITATLSAVSPLTATVDYATADATALAGSDYITTSGTLTFTPGVTSQTFSVPILDDEADETAETVSLTLFGPVQVVLGAPAVAVLTIVDDDNDAPVAADDTFTATEDSQANPLTVLANDTDPELNLLAVSAVGVPDQGGTAISAVTHITYTPAVDFSGLETFTYTVSDGRGGRDSAAVTVTVTSVNDAPVLAPIGDKNVDEGALLSFTATGTDVDLPPDTLIYSLDAGAPAGASIDPAAGQFTWTPDEAQGPGVYTVTVRITDNGAPPLNDCETIQITVAEVNQAPVLSPIGAKNVDEGVLLSFTATVTDADLPPNTLTFSLDAGAPAGASIDPATGLFTWTPTEAQGPGVYPVTVRVADDGTPPLDDYETIQITVAEVNQAPALALIGDQNVDEGALLSFTAAAADADVPTNTLTYSLDAGTPAGASIDPATGLFAWIPSEAQGPGVYTVTVRVTDNGGPPLDDWETIEITVAEVNQAPELMPIGNNSVDEGTLLSFTATATDADLPANTLTFSLDAGAPAGASIDPATGLFTWMPGEAQGPGIYPVNVRVTDNGAPPLDDYETIQITVTEVNQAPELMPIGSKSVDEGVLLSFTAVATDPDLPANGLTFSLDAGAPTGASIDPATGLFTWTPSEAQGPGVYPVTIRVTDNGAPPLDDYETIQVTAAEVNLPPVAVADSYTTSEETPLVVAAPGVLGNDGDVDLPPNPLAAILDGGPVAGSLDLSADGSFAYTPTLDYNGVITFAYTVSDGLAFSEAAVVSVTVTPICDYAVQPEPPAAAQAGDVGATVTYTLRLTNSGECVDVLDVTVAALWPAEAPATVGPLAAGAGTDVMVTVAIPAGANAGDQDVATITFTSQGDGGVSAISMLTTTAEVPTYRVYLPLVFKNQ